MYHWHFINIMYCFYFTQRRNRYGFTFNFSPDFSRHTQVSVLARTSVLPFIGIRIHYLPLIRFRIHYLTLIQIQDIPLKRIRIHYTVLTSEADPDPGLSSETDPDPRLTSNSNTDPDYEKLNKSDPGHWFPQLLFI